MIIDKNNKEQGMKIIEAINYLNEHKEEQMELIQELMENMSQLDADNLPDKEEEDLKIIIENMIQQDKDLVNLEPEEALLSVIRSFTLCSGMVILFGECLPNLSMLVEEVSRLFNQVMN